MSPMSHAGYYPGGKLMTVKVVFERETYRLLGAQLVGYEGVDKRIDVLATAIRAGMTAIQLKDLDLAYAAPTSSVWNCFTIPFARFSTIKPAIFTGSLAEE